MRQISPSAADKPAAAEYLEADQGGRGRKTPTARGRVACRPASHRAACSQAGWPPFTSNSDRPPSPAQSPTRRLWPAPSVPIATGAVTDSSTRFSRREQTLMQRIRCQIQAIGPHRSAIVGKAHFGEVGRITQRLKYGAAQRVRQINFTGKSVIKAQENSEIRASGYGDQAGPFVQVWSSSGEIGNIGSPRSASCQAASSSGRCWNAHSRTSALRHGAPSEPRVLVALAFALGRCCQACGWQLLAVRRQRACGRILRRRIRDAIGASIVRFGVCAQPLIPATSHPYHRDVNPSPIGGDEAPPLRIVSARTEGLPTRIVESPPRRPHRVRSGRNIPVAKGGGRTAANPIPQRQPRTDAQRTS